MSHPLPLLRAWLGEADGKPGQGKTQMRVYWADLRMHKEQGSQETWAAFEDAPLLSVAPQP